MKTFNRIVIYICGLLTLALGIVLNTKANLGVSPIISVPYSIAVIWGQNLGAVTAGFYILFVIGQLVILRKRFRPVQFLQIPLSIIFGVLINFFGELITIGGKDLPTDLVLLVLGIFFTGLGAALTMMMNILPNAADGIVQAVSQRTGKKLGAVKNILDASCVAVAAAISMAATGRIIGIGLGTVLAAVGVGRVIALVNRLYQKKLPAQAARFKLDAAPQKPPVKL
ncbi:Uncharacterized membrane protein YczE [Sporobacter termitidis DSM 10068]|uniref:Uncharacterized membrane protein YczE n=1 Tax=Sporobacter termitidis DSM 10068 TaxID=1123282 RepID=A0A1M5XBT8_9FIRM|nr:DUF6198 family protein [Sporobacter termitidis]SHH97281.1 Uncharacterized membrane protein YczE [Sporobacter termitidis DSM 10068]